MLTFHDLLGQPLGVVFIDKVAGKDRWQVQTGLVVPGPAGLAIRFPPQVRPAFHLDPAWEERLRPTPAGLAEYCTAPYVIYVRVDPLPEKADLDEYTFTGLNLND